MAARAPPRSNFVVAVLTGTRSGFGLQPENGGQLTHPKPISNRDSSSQSGVTHANPLHAVSGGQSDGGSADRGLSFDGSRLGGAGSGGSSGPYAGAATSRADAGSAAASV